MDGLNTDLPANASRQQLATDPGHFALSGADGRPARGLGRLHHSRITGTDLQVTGTPQGAGVELHLPVQSRPHDCMECGACAKNCPAGAISVEAGVGCFSALLRETLLGGEAGCG